MDDPAKVPVHGIEINNFSEENGCDNPADATCPLKRDLNAGMQSEFSKKLSNSPDKNKNYNKFELDFNISSDETVNDKSFELLNCGKTEDNNLAYHPTFVNQHNYEKEILGDQNNDEEILLKDVHLHNEDILPKDVDQHDEEKSLLKEVVNLHDDENEIIEGQNSSKEILSKDVDLHNEDALSNDADQHDDVETLPKDTVNLHDDENGILKDLHNGKEILSKDVDLYDENTLSKGVDQYDEEILPKDVDLHDDEILLSDVVDQHHKVILSKDVDQQYDNAILPKDVARLDDDSCDFLPKDDVDQPNGIDHQCDVNELDSQEPKHTLMMDEDSCDRFSNDSCSPQKFETESFHGRTHKSREKTALPYFQLPTPDLEEFLIETDKKFHDSEIKNSDVLQEVKTSKSHTSKDQFIIFDIGPATPMDKFKNKFMNQTKQLHADPSPRFSSKTFQGLQINSPLLSKEMEEKDSPGFKRLVLKEYLKQKIDEKKVAAFNRFKEASKLDEEEEMYIESDDSDGSFSDNEGNEFQKRLKKMMAPKENGDVSELENDKEMSENLDEECSDSEKLEIVIVDSQPAEDDSDDDDDFLPNKISQKEQIISKGFNSFHTDSEESEDEIMFTKKSKHSKRLIEDSDEESETNSVSYVHSQNENKIGEMKKPAAMSEENSLDSVDATVNDECESILPVCNSNQDANLKKNNAVHESYESQKNSKDFFTVTPEISSSAIPSYQPGGGFQNEESNDSSDSSNSDSKDTVGNKFLKNGNSDSNSSSSQGIVGKRSLSSSTLNNPVDSIQLNNQFGRDYSGNKTPAFGVSLDDLPISQEDSDNMFASQDVDNICSGVFQDSVPPSSLLEESILKLKDPGIPAVTEKVEDFFDAEAELSGEDDGFDDVSGDEENEVNDIIAADDDLPSNEELRDGIADLFMKRVNDDDDMLIKKVQEHFLEDGELNVDGAGRARRFQWKNDDSENNDQQDMSESDNEETDESWNALNREKVKWQQENVKQLNEDLDAEEFVKKPILRMKILGKPDNLADLNNALPLHLKRKRPRGSLFNLDDGSASQVLKKLKAAEGSSGGSRTTKHFVFRNDVVGDVVAVPKEVAITFIQQTSNTHVEVGELSVFDNI